MNNWIGPYKVIVTMGTHAYRLEVPEGTGWHEVVHPTLLKPFRTGDDLQGMDEDKDNEIYEVKTIPNSRKYAGVVKCRIQWKGYNELVDTWEEFERLNNSPEKLKEYREKLPNKLRDERDV